MVKVVPCFHLFLFGRKFQYEIGELSMRIEDFPKRLAVLLHLVIILCNLG